MFKSLLSSLFTQVFPQASDRATRERNYLNGAVSRYDLESREREIERGKFASV
jgi:hypothetical protein